MLYLAMIDITKKWTGRRQDWSMIHAQLAIYFEDRMSDEQPGSKGKGRYAAGEAPMNEGAP